MLARYLRTSQQPIRYAMDPVHAQAIRNYLALTTRAYDVPGLYQQARPHLPGGREGELLHHLFSAMIGEHDPDALAAFLDAHQDYTGQPTPDQVGMPFSPTPVERLLHTLAGLHRDTRSEQPHATAAIAGFSPDRLHDPELERKLRDAYRSPHPWGTMQLLPLRDNVRALTQLLAGSTQHRIPAMPEHRERIGQLQTPLDSGRALAHVDLMDALHSLIADPRSASVENVVDLTTARSKPRHHLESIAIPHLLGQ